MIAIRSKHTPDMLEKMVHERTLKLCAEITRAKIQTLEMGAREKKYRSLFENAPDGIILIDPEGTILDCNRKECELLGRERSECLGKKVTDFLSPQSRTFFDLKLPALEGIGSIEVESEIITKTGKTVPIWRNMTAQYSDDGQFTGAIIHTRDITDRKYLEDELKKANRKLEEQSFLDGLTGIANRRAFDEHFSREFNRMRRLNKPLSLVLCDIDYFKNYNDFYGHQKGDSCLEQVARILKNAVRRPGDQAARYGGEEFTVIFSDTETSTAVDLAEILRRSIQGLAIPHKASEIDTVVTASFGIAGIVPSGETRLEEIIALADARLYSAKRTGRNRVVHY